MAAASSDGSGNAATTLQGRQVASFGGKKVNFVQVGLGTNCTFVQNLAGRREEWHGNIHWLLRACSQWDPALVSGVSVEPVQELLDGFREAARDLPNVLLINAAMGDREEYGAKVTYFGVSSRDAIVEPFSKEVQEELLWHFQYLANMSTVGNTHPALPDWNEHVLKKYSIDLKFQSQQADIWTWGKLARTCGFSGCEVLIVDTEGHDPRILRSMIEHCHGNDDAWPDVIQFETMGHGDQLDGPGAEWGIIADLTDEGYVLVMYSYVNTVLVHWRVWWYERRVKFWVKEYRCTGCRRRWAFPYCETTSGTWCRRCLHNNYHRWGPPPRRRNRRRRRPAQPPRDVQTAPAPRDGLEGQTPPSVQQDVSYAAEQQQRRWHSWEPAPWTHGSTPGSGSSSAPSSSGGAADQAQSINGHYQSARGSAASTNSGSTWATSSSSRQRAWGARP